VTGVPWLGPADSAVKFIIWEDLTEIVRKSSGFKIGENEKHRSL